MSGEVLIQVENLSKKFCRNLKKSLWYGVQDVGAELLGRNSRSPVLRPDEFWALKDISFELHRGECLGLIGRNGAGKSTLLRLLNGLIKPDQGRIAMVGSVGALIELNTGINPILTGRENIYVNASVLGVPKKRVDRIIDGIIDYSGIEEFIDTPVQYYSSGMKVRLGFSIATSILKPDVLLLDEVLAVGDAHFRSKCYNRVGELAKKSAVIFVSHNMNHIAQICDRCLLLERGRIAHLGGVTEGIQRYLERTEGGDDESDEDAFEVVEHPIECVSFEWSAQEIEYGDTIELTATIETCEAVPSASVRIPFYDTRGIVVTEWNSKRIGKNINLEQGVNTLRIRLGPLYLKSGIYKLAFVLNDSGGIRLPVWSYKKHSINIGGAVEGAATYQLPAVE